MNLKILIWMLGVLALASFVQAGGNNATVHYLFNQCSGTAVIDNGSGGTDGVATNMDTSACDASTLDGWNSTGKLDRSLGFDGDDNIVLTDDVVINNISWTVASWVFSLNGADAFPMFYRQNTAGTDQMLFIEMDGVEVYGFADNNGVTEHSFVNDTIYGEWVHIVWAADPTNMVLYLNGRLADTVARTTTVGWSGEQALGGIEFATQQMTQGWIDDFRIFNFTLTTAQIQLIYNDGDGTENDLDFLEVAPKLIPDLVNFNLTSGNIGGDIISIFVTNDTTPTFTVDTTPIANVSIGIANQNYSDMGASRFCTGGGTQNHTCTLIAADLLGNGTVTVYFSTINLDRPGNQTAVATSSVIVHVLEETHPFIEFVDNTPVSGTTGSENFVFVNVSADDQFVANLSALIDFDSSLVGWWRFEDEIGTNATDESSYGNHGNATNGVDTLQAGVRGRGFEFDGDDDLVSILADSSLDLVNNGNYTVTLWMKWDFDNGANNNTLVQQQDGSGTGFSVIGIDSDGTDCAGDNEIHSRLGSVNTCSGVDAVTNTWQHIVLTVEENGTSDVLRFYIDGIESDIGTVNSATNDNAEWRVGTGKTGNGSFNGTIDEVQFWNRLLSRQEINASFNNSIYRLERNFTGLSVGTHNYTAYVVDGGGNINQTETRTFTFQGPATINFSLDFSESDRTYELGTTAYLEINLSVTAIVCFDVNESFYGSNVSCGTSPFTHNITFFALRNTTFNDSEWTKTFSSDVEFGISLDNRTFLLNVSFNLSSSGGADNVSIFVNSSSAEVVLPGLLLGRQNTQNMVGFEGDLWETVNLTFTTAGVKSFTINISTHDISDNTSALNFSFNLSGFAVDVGNDVDYIENFTTFDRTNFTELVNTSGINGSWDNFVVNHSAAGVSRWDSDVSLPGGGECSIDEYQVGGSGIYNGRTSLSCSGAGAFTSDIRYTAEEFDIRNLSRIDSVIDRSVNCIATQAGAGCTARASVGVYDGSSRQDFFSEEVSCSGTSCSSSGNINVSIRLKEGTANQWDVYLNDALSVTKTITLDPSKLWKLTYHTSTSGSGAVNSLSSSLQIFDISVGALIGNKSGTNNSEYNNIVSFQSLPLNQSSNDVIAALLTATDLSKENYGDVNVSYYLSNDNGVNWQEATNRRRLVFDTTGGELVYKINCTSESVNDTCLIGKVQIQVVPGNAEDVSADFGSDGTANFQFTGFLNESNNNTVFTNSSESILAYARNNCEGRVTCAVPVSISTNSPGIVQVSGVNMTRKIGRYFIGLDILQSTTNMFFQLNRTSGSVTVNDIFVDFLGTKTFNITAFFSGNNDNNAVNISRQITTHFSDFSIAFPANISNWQFSPKSREDKNVTPFGQTNRIPIRNISNQAYSTVINVSVWLNESFSELVNLSFNTTPFRAGATRLTTDPQQLASVAINSSFGIWSWLDLNVTSSRFIIPAIWISAICEVCVRTYDYAENKILI